MVNPVASIMTCAVATRVNLGVTIILFRECVSKSLPGGLMALGPSFPKLLPPFLQLRLRKGRVVGWGPLDSLAYLLALDYFLYKWLGSDLPTLGFYK